ncbi:MAG: cyclase family protein [Chlorobiota bacterium]
MRIWVELPGRRVAVDPNSPIELAFPIIHEAQVPRAFGLQQPRIVPVLQGSFVGSVAAGGPCNCDYLQLIPHGHTTHTECIGHITAERIPLYHCLRRYLFWAQLVTVQPQVLDNGDRVITAAQLQSVLVSPLPEALIVRTVGVDSRGQDFSGTNPPYFTPEAAELLARHGILHLLTDLPSIDREEDGGALWAHRAFWQYPHAPRVEATITELLSIPPALPDGEYLLQFQILNVDSDASPSKPVLYAPLEVVSG